MRSPSPHRRPVASCPLWAALLVLAVLGLSPTPASADIALPPPQNAPSPTPPAPRQPAPEPPPATRGCSCSQAAAPAALLVLFAGLSLLWLRRMGLKSQAQLDRPSGTRAPRRFSDA